MVVYMSVHNFREVQKVCAPLLERNERIAALSYIMMKFDGGVCSAYGCNPAQISKVDVPCVVQGEPVTVLLSPVKIVPRTKVVKIESDSENTDISFYSDEKFEEFISGNAQLVQDTKPFDIEGKALSPAIKKIEETRNGFCIAVNPKYLIDALSGMKDCDSVVMNFTDNTSAFIIRPYKTWDNENITSMVLPVRIT